MKNKFIVIEGIEGSGKTTAQINITKILKKYGIKEIINTHEPGSTPVCEKLRDIIKHSKENIIDKTEILIFYAARIQLLETLIKPALKNGFWVIGDRHDLSSQAYQGGNKLNVKSIALINFLKKFLLNNFEPDLTFYLDVKPCIGIKRVYNRDKKLDRFENKNIDFFNKVRQKYLELAAIDKKIKIIDATKSLEKVTLSIKHFLKKWLIKQK